MLVALVVVSLTTVLKDPSVNLHWELGLSSSHLYFPSLVQCQQSCPSSRFSTVNAVNAEKWPGCDAKGKPVGAKRTKF